MLGEDVIEPRELRRLLRGGDFDAAGRFGGLAFLNACQTAGSSKKGSFVEALHAAGLSGIIATEEQTVDIFANPFGLDFLEKFLAGGVPVGKLLQRMRGGCVPLGLLYATYCPPGIRVRKPELRTESGVPIIIKEDLEATGAVLGVATIEEALLPLPGDPYRSLAYYEREHRALFAGRDRDVERFAVMLDDPGSRLLVLHGESGAGKSSFLRAGVIPYLDGADRLKVTHPDRLRMAHHGPKNGRSGQERQDWFTPSCDLS